MESIRSPFDNPNYNIRTKPIYRYTFVELLILIIVSWIIIQVWQRALDNLFYSTFKLDQNSTFDSVTVALVTTLIFLLFIYYVGPIATQSFGLNIMEDKLSQNI